MRSDTARPRLLILCSRAIADSTLLRSIESQRARHSACLALNRANFTAYPRHDKKQCRIARDAEATAACLLFRIRARQESNVPEASPSSLLCTTVTSEAHLFSILKD